MLIKICGTTNAEDARLSTRLGADALGFIFAPSRRLVTVEQVVTLTAGLPAGVERVGVFTEPDVAGIAHAVEVAGLTAVQMHWSYQAAPVRAVRATVGAAVKLWQVVPFAIDGEDPETAEREFTYSLRGALHDRELAAVLLDVQQGGRSGGLGQTLPWGRVASIVRTARASSAQAGRRFGFTPGRLLLAGGLSAENVREAIAVLQPDGVDVVSGVESRPGVKDPERLQQFIEAAREAAGEISAA